MKHLITAFALAFTLALSPVAYARDEGDSQKMMMQSSPDAAKAPFDIQYLDTMSQHHRDGIKMMEMAVDKAQSQEIKSMAQRMMDDQQKEIEELKSIREHVKADAPEAVNMKMPGMMMMDKEMAKMEAASGSDFDRHFLKTMTSHHKDAVKMSDAALKQAKHAEVKTKAQEIHDKQKKEVSDMEMMLSKMKS